MTSDANTKAKAQTERALALLKDKKPYDARALFEKALAKDKRLIDAHLGLGDALIALGEFNAARNRFDTAKPLNEKSTVPYIGNVKVRIAELTEQGSQLINSDDSLYWSDEDYTALHDILTELDLGFQREPDNAELRLLRGFWASVDEYWQEQELIIEDLEFARKHGRQDGEALRMIGRGLVAMGEIEEGLAVIDAAEDLEPLDAHTLRARIWAKRWPREEANLPVIEADFQKLLALNPDSFDDLQNFARFYQEEDRSDEAAEILHKITALKPDLFHNWHESALLLHKLKRMDEAITAFDRALEIERENARAFYHRGNVYKDLEQDKRSLADYSSAIRYDPSCAFAYNNRGYIHERLGKEKKKLNDWLTGYACNQKIPELNRNLASHYFRAKGWEAAIIYADALLGRRPDDLTGLLHKARAHRHLEQFDDAMTTIEHAIEVSPDDRITALNERGIIYGKQGKLELQIKDCRNALKLAPNDKGVQTNLATRLAQTEHYEEALKRQSL